MVLVFIPTLGRLKTPHQSGNRTYDLLERQTNALPSELRGQVSGWRAFDISELSLVPSK